ncbi:hypothetical protein BDQ17DRAFT_1351768 [Cyathus striatus]|nr:hypothetical protein BDQ17DRAFT_1351768 [Cyathus striatus]
MPSYYPSQGSYAPQPGVVYTSSSHHGHGHHHHHQPTVYAPNEAYYGQPTVVAPPMVASTSVPVVMQPSGYGGQQYYGQRLPVGERLRRFFGLAPRSNFRYKSNRTSWGFLGYSRRPRYVDARTGGEVDRHGRPIYRV